MYVTPTLYMINPPIFTSPELPKTAAILFRHPCPCSSHDFSILSLSNNGIVIYVVASFASTLSSHSFNPHLPVFCLLRIQLLLFPHTSCGLLLLLLCTIMIMTIFSTRQYCQILRFQQHAFGMWEVNIPSLPR